MKTLTAAATPAISLSFDFPSTGEQPYGPMVEAGFQKLLDSTSALKNLVDGVKAAGGVTDAMIGARAVDPALVPTSSNPATHTDRLSQIANRLAAILGSDWYGAPAASLASLAPLAPAAKVLDGSRFQLSGTVGAPSGAAVTVETSGLVVYKTILTIPANEKLYVRRFRAGPATDTVWDVKFNNIASVGYAQGTDDATDSTVYNNATASPITAELEVRIRSNLATAVTANGNTGFWVDLEVAP